MDHKTRSDRAGGERWRKDARVVRTRAALRGALVDLLARHDFADITVAMIVAEAELGYATFFRHYADTHALLTDIADAAITEFITAMIPTMLSGDQTRVARSLVDFIAERRALCRALLIGGGEAVRRDVTARAVGHSASIPGVFDATFPPDLAVTHAVNATLTAIGWWLGPGKDTDRDHFATILERLSFDPVRAARAEAS